MDITTMQNLLENQRAYFKSGKTLPVESRIAALKSLKAALIKNENQIYSALYNDLGKSESESYMCEVGMVYSELSYMLRHIKKFSKKRGVHTPLAQTASKSYVMPSPKGSVLIMSPWNYPFMLTFDPLIDALAAGNVVMLKPSAYAPHTAEVIAEIAKEAFDPGLVSVVTGGRAENEHLLDQKFDHIFFTGSKAVGKVVMKKAAEHLTTISLELGGKSPCIVDKSADIPLSARRIVFGKFLNCGQTCVAPDYILCHEDIREELLKAIILEIHRQFGKEPLENECYGKIINEKHFDRIAGLIKDEKLLFGGKLDREHLRIEPTVLAEANFKSPAMCEEIFGPVLPVISFKNIAEVIDIVESNPHPLALYIFSKDKSVIDEVTSKCTFGGGCVNDTIIHLATSEMGFGGVGESGMGAYHGKTGFDAFTHYKSIVDKKTFMDLPMRYQPYTRLNDKIIRLFMR